MDNKYTGFRVVLAIIVLVIYGGIMTAYAIPQIKHQMPEWGFNEHLAEAGRMSADADRAAKANVIQKGAANALAKQPLQQWGGEELVSH